MAEGYIAFLEAEGLSSIPDEVLQRPDCTTLKLGRNQFNALPLGVFPRLPNLVLLDLSKNKLAGIPNDIATCRAMKTLLLGHNNLKIIPPGIFLLAGLEQLDLNHNRLTDAGGPWYHLSSLQSLNLAHNKLRMLPPDIGWLPLTSLELEGNEQLRVPEGVLAGGFRSVISYLQVICEQHRLVEQHLDKFAAPATEGEGGGPLRARPSDPHALSTLVARRLGAAAVTGVLDVKFVGTEAALAELPKLQAVYVADVRHNGWTAVPAEVLKLNGLVVLNASDNDIETLAEGITPQHLGVLNLSFNRLSRLPPALGAAPVLQQMYLANNALTDLPRTFACLPMVDLFLSENAFERVPVAVLGMSQLAKLSMACCKLREVPDALGSVATLKFLDLSFNQLRGLPDGLSRLTALNALNISFNPLSGFPPVLTNITGLLELNLDHTGVSTVPEGLGELRRLEGLQLEGCPLPQPAATLYAANPLLLVQVHNTALTSLDLSGLGLDKIPQLSRLIGLTALDLSHNAFARPPPELLRLTDLHQLALRGNPLLHPFDVLLEAQGDLACVELMDPEADKLDLSGCGLESLPPELAPHAGHLSQLKLSNNALTATDPGLPDWLASFAHLATLVLDRNRLDRLPPVLTRLPAMSILMASFNAISALQPDVLAGLSRLKALVLQNNQVSELPAAVSKLIELKALVLSSNRLTSLPDALCGCSGLRLLDLSHNALTGLPSGIGALSKLKALKLAHNELPSVPRGMSCLLGLTELTLANNPLPLQGHELNATGAPAVRQMIAALLAACASLPAAAHAAELEAAAAALAAKAATAAMLAAAAEAEEAAAAAAAGIGGGAAEAEADAAAVMADVAALRDEEEQRAAAPPPAVLTSGEIRTLEDPDAIRKRVEMLQEELKQLHPDTRWLYVAKHAETIGRDPLRPKADAWTKVPIMNIPRIIAAISSPPPPPPPGDGAGPGGAGLAADGKPRRPQVMHRFKRVADQSTIAMNLLNRVQDVLHSGQGSGGGGVGGGGTGRGTGGGSIGGSISGAVVGSAGPASPSRGSPMTHGSLTAMPTGVVPLPPGVLPVGIMPPGMGGVPPLPPPGMGMGMGMLPPPGMGMPLPPGMSMLPPPPPGMMFPPGMIPPPGVMLPPGMNVGLGMGMSLPPPPPGMMFPPPPGMFPPGMMPPPPPPGGGLPGMPSAPAPNLRR
ncbi:hypothetical protein PLESTF_000760700 [Pleodorina starrii]|nr:hypothetical protein PLESTM_001339400 [Pleodorina starrii]GLC68935.1 hypothetical protein PLESTF_000760700 [Pleodorina starrii]